MANVDPIVLSYGFAAAEFLFLAAVLVIAALRNHFAHREFRPAIYALAFLSFIVFTQNALRVYSSYLRTTGQMERYLAFIEGPVWLWGNWLFVLAGAILVFTLVLAYPASRRTVRKKKS